MKKKVLILILMIVAISTFSCNSQTRLHINNSKIMQPSVWVNEYKDELYEFQLLYEEDVKNSRYISYKFDTNNEMKVYLEDRGNLFWWRSFLLNKTSKLILVTIYKVSGSLQDTTLGSHIVDYLFKIDDETHTAYLVCKFENSKYVIYSDDMYTLVFNTDNKSFEYYDTNTLQLLSGNKIDDFETKGREYMIDYDIVTSIVTLSETSSCFFTYDSKDIYSFVWKSGMEQHLHQ